MPRPVRRPPKSFPEWLDRVRDALGTVCQTGRTCISYFEWAGDAYKVDPGESFRAALDELETLVRLGPEVPEDSEFFPAINWLTRLVRELPEGHKWNRVFMMSEPTRARPDLVEAFTAILSAFREPRMMLPIPAGPPKPESPPPGLTASHAGQVPPKPEAPRVPLVRLGDPSDEPTVCGKNKPRLTAARYDIVNALLEAGEGGLTGDEFVTKSGRGGAVNTLKALARSDPDWERAVQLAGEPGGRYRIRWATVDGP